MGNVIDSTGQMIDKINDVLKTKLFASELGNLAWERERTTLIKKKCHEHDEEWRMILPGLMNPPIVRE